MLTISSVAKIPLLLLFPSSILQLLSPQSTAILLCLLLGLEHLMVVAPLSVMIVPVAQTHSPTMIAMAIVLVAEGKAFNILIRNM
jgi:hypothetical protein